MTKPTVTIAFQGEPGAFSDDAARALRRDADTRGYDTFDDAAAALERGEVDLALLPVENSISGAVPRVYDLLWGNPHLRIVDEIVHPIVQNLIGTPDATLAGLREVRSHPVALEQCRAFLGARPGLRSIIVADTAGAVREIVARGDRRVGAIGSRLAAKRYGGRILAAAIQDVAGSFTRFFLLQRDGTPSPAPTRACIAMRLAHRPGTLRDALAAFADLGLNLRTLVSRPSLEEPFTYRFYCEIVELDADRLARALARIDGEVRTLGLY